MAELWGSLQDHPFIYDSGNCPELYHYKQDNLVDVTSV